MVGISTRTGVGWNVADKFRTKLGNRSVPNQPYWYLTLVAFWRWLDEILVRSGSRRAIIWSSICFRDWPPTHFIQRLKVHDTAFFCSGTHVTTTKCPSRGMPVIKSLSGLFIYVSPSWWKGPLFETCRFLYSLVHCEPLWIHVVHQIK